MKELDRIYNEDCILGMREIPTGSVDCVITDPPYEYTNCGNGGIFAERKLVKERHIDFISNGFDIDAVFNEFMRVCKIPNILVFCSNKQISKIMSWFESRGLAVTLLAWHKTNPIPLGNNKHLSDLEFIVYARAKGATFNNDVPLHFKSKLYTSGVVDNKSRLHPTQKDVNHIRQYLLQFTQPHDVVLDAFMGSGTTAIACIRENRHFIGFELNPEYYEIACNRVRIEKRQLTLFDE